MIQAPPVVMTLIWEWPLRVWHWLFALSITGSLATGLSGDIGLMDWHLRLGYCACGLLVFRLLWGFFGGAYSRWRHYWPSPTRILQHFKGSESSSAHTAPGIALVLLLLAAVAVQAVTGLFTTDDIFIEGPLVRSADDAVVSAMTAIHHRGFYLVIAAIVIHLTAHIVYGLKGSRMPLAMFSGRKVVAETVTATPSRGWQAVVTAALAFGIVIGGLEMLT
jgi:cytochrome b